MNSKILLVFISFIVLFVVVITIFNNAMCDELIQIRVSDELTISFKEICTSCYDQTLGGHDKLSTLTDVGLSVGELETLIRGGGDTVPPFLNIHEPLLIDLANYINNL